jgi:toxin-antitoxin system PIN domain toxin
VILPDANILIYAHNSSAPEHDAALRWWRDAALGAETVGIAWVVVLAFVRLLSNPRVVLRPAPPEDLLDIIIEILELPSVRVVSPGSQHAGIMRRFFSDTGAESRLTTDVHLAALAIEHDATLVSNDVDFTRFGGLKLLNPIERS